MQIGSTSPDHAPSVIAQQGALPPPPPAVTQQQKDKDGDHRTTVTSIDSNTGRQVNVVA